MLNHQGSTARQEAHWLKSRLHQITRTPRRGWAKRFYTPARSDRRCVPGERQLSLGNPFFATLGIIGVLTFGQSLVVPPPYAGNAALTDKVGSHQGNSLSALSQQMGAPFNGTIITTVIQGVQTAFRPADDGSSTAAPTGDRGPTPTLTSYVVQPDDTVSSIAAAHGISATTIIWVNGLTDPDTIQAGQVLQLMSVDGTIHRVREGDTAAGIAEGYGIPVEELVAANQLGDGEIVRPSQILLVPNAVRGHMESPQNAPAARPAGRKSEQAFIASLAQPAQESQRITGVPASITIAQAILETYWGTSFLAREANNYFGIKAHYRPGTAGVIWIDAWEVEGGRDVTRPEPFRKYATVADSLVDHGRFFLENSRYAYALEARHDPREFARRINAAGYATDPGYASKLIALLDRFNLQQYDL